MDSQRRPLRLTDIFARLKKELVRQGFAVRLDRRPHGPSGEPAKTSVPRPKQLGPSPAGAVCAKAKKDAAISTAYKEQLIPRDAHKAKPHGRTLSLGTDQELRIVDWRESRQVEKGLFLPAIRLPLRRSIRRNSDLAAGAYEGNMQYISRVQRLLSSRKQEKRSLSSSSRNPGSKCKPAAPMPSGRKKKNSTRRIHCVFCGRQSQVSPVSSANFVVQSLSRQDRQATSKSARIEYEYASLSEKKKNSTASGQKESAKDSYYGTEECAVAKAVRRLGRVVVLQKLARIPHADFD